MVRRRWLLLGAALVVAAVATTALVGGGSDGTEPAASPAPTSTPQPTATPTPEPVARVWQPLGEPGVGGQVTSLSISPTDPSLVLVGGDMLGVGRSVDGGVSWEPTFGFQSWEIAEFTWHPTDPETVWVGTMSGPYVSTDGGATWESRRQGLPPVSAFSYSAPIEKILVDPNAPDRLLALGGSQRRWDSPGDPAWGAVWESVDAGQSWSQVGTVAGGRNVTSATFLADDVTLLATTGAGGVWRSADGGRSWGEANAGLPHRVPGTVLAHPTNPSEAWVALQSSGSSPGGVWRTEDGGRTWLDANEGLARVAGASQTETSRYTTIEVAPSAPDTLYTADRGTTSGGLFRSDDGGRTWRQTAEGESRLYASRFTATAVAVHPQDPLRLIIGQDESLFGTSDGGASWQDLTAQTSDGGFVGTGYSGLVATRIGFDPEQPGGLVLQAFDGGHLLQTTDGQGWRRTLRTWDEWGGAYDHAFAGGDVVYALLGQQNRFNGIAKSTDGGATWVVQVGGQLPERRSSNARGPEAIHAVDDRTVLASIHGRLYRTEDGGETWSVVSDVADGDIAAHPGAPDVLYVAGNGAVHVSTDSGRSFQPVAGSPPNVRRIAFDPADPSVLYATSWRDEGAGGLWRYDGSWTRLLDDPQAFDVGVDPEDGDHLVLATSDSPFHDEARSRGVLESTDGGATWAEVNEGLAVRRVAAVAFDPFEPDRVVIGTVGGGFYEAQLP